MKKTLVATVLLSAATSSFAWGDREQGILTGIVGTLIVQHASQNTEQTQGGRVRPTQPMIIYPSVPVYVPVPTHRVESYYPSTQQCVTRIYHNQSGVVVNQVTECR